MRSLRSSRLFPILAVAAAGLLATEAPAARRPIDAVKGKRYRLTADNGPWMIMVASFKEPPPEHKTEGMTPQEAADELVYLLRKKGIPAYTFAQETIEGTVDAFDRTGRIQPRRFTAQQGSIVVLAGNYKNIEPGEGDGKTAQQTLAWVKDFEPEFLTAEDPNAPQRIEGRSGGFFGQLKRLRSGGIWRPTKGQPKPLSGAFLTTNPLLSPEELSARRHDPLIAKLNPDTPLCLLNNPGRYTLLVATFTGRVTSSERKAELWDDDHLDDAALDAWQLANRLRDQKIDAWVFHERYRSIVTVGSFDTPQDARIPPAQQQYGAKYRIHPLTKQEVLTAEAMTQPDPRNPQGAPVKTWIFDPSPQLIEVPRSR
jgi:hypothetical protein